METEKTIQEQCKDTIETINRVFDEYKQRHAKELGYRVYRIENNKLIPSN